MIYAFQCPSCGSVKEIHLSLADYESFTKTTCDNKLCSRRSLTKKEQIINFQGEINMNSSSVGVAHRKYSNKAGGPKPVIDGKVRNDLKIKS
jgi:hypothetical protein